MRWLSINDKEWLERVLPSRVLHCPLVGRPQKAPEEVTRANDREMARKVPQAKQALLSLPGFPRKITRPRLRSYLGMARAFGAPREPLTETQKALLANSESWDEIAARRLNYRIQELKRTGEHVRFSDLLSNAHITLLRIQGSPALAEAVANAKRALGL